MANTIRLICPNLRCRTVLSVPPTARGQTVRCRNCGMRVQVPSSSGAKPMPENAGPPETAKKSG